MPRFARTPRPAAFHHSRPTVGAPPGTIHIGEDAEPTRLSVIRYDSERITEELPSAADGVRPDAGQVLWLDVQGLGDIEMLRGIADGFGIHPLALEDIAHVHQRPKLEMYDDHLLIVTRIPNPADGALTEQVSLVLGAGYVITFQERPKDCFDPVRRRLRANTGRIRRSGPSYLAYALIDAAIDSFFPLLEAFGERLEALESGILETAGRDSIAGVHNAKRELLELRRAIWPQREMISALVREETPFVDPAVHVYLRDCQDHAIQLVDLIETYREIGSGLVDLYMSETSARTNDVMRVLTIIATIFIPLGFFASLYGMNFDSTASPFNMPELGWAYGYPYALGVMALVAVVLLAIFWKRGWFDSVTASRAAGRDHG